MRHPQWFIELWNWIDWKWFWTLVIAIYGAALATYREVMARRERRAFVKVSMSLAIVMAGDGHSRPQVQVDVQNHGHTDVIFNSNQFAVHIKGWKGKSLLAIDQMSNVNFPHTLKPSGSFWLMKDREHLISGLRDTNQGRRLKIRAVVFDAIGRPHRSGWQTVDVG